MELLTLTLRSRSTKVRSASPPTAIRPLQARLKTRAGPAQSKSTTCGNRSSPFDTMSRSKGTSVWVPGIPEIGDPSFASQVEDPCRPRAEQVHDVRQQKFSLRHHVQKQGHERLGSGHSRMPAWVRLCLVFEQMRPVIGADHVDDPVANRPPQRFAMSDLEWAGS